MTGRARPPLRVALIGLGAIGRVLADELSLRPVADVELVGVLCRQPRPAGTLAVPVVTSLQALLALRPELVVEAAGHAAVQDCGAGCLRAGCDLLLASVGALADAALLLELESAARDAGRQLLLPSGALAGLDYLEAAGLAGLHSVCLRSRKPPLAWRGTEAERLLDLTAITEATRFFRGSAREAARRFPKNANVAATLALCTLGLDETQVELFADPGVQLNVHEIEARGRAGELRLELRNAAAEDNPRTSLITPYSLLRSILNHRSRRSG